MLTLHITGDNGFDAEVVAKPRHILAFERATGTKFSELEDEVSMATIYQLAHLVMKIQHPQDTPVKLAEFEETFDVLPVADEQTPDPTPAGA
ncbi:hypothetical protein QRX60_17020 [Amycolatopsis mongoliensis]|uniref:Uncharacterized protein n=1 Tax=Amycolatopsis mongoliensis TaxID=715475 RepID=A0A9Y2NH52_9PSEU|nr:hypothetical protein [Amycolatopsis sp. 4-36]WIY05461.1 hypothetical protein QRX60_17020 [Amycolatopsis sp. 4-36]